MNSLGKVVSITFAIIAFVLVYMIGVPYLISAQNTLMVIAGFALIIGGAVGAVVYAIYAFTLKSQIKQADINE